MNLVGGIPEGAEADRTFFNVKRIRMNDDLSYAIFFHFFNRNEIFERETKNLEFKNVKILKKIGFQNSSSFGRT